jgi:hypothetical protein
VHGYGAELIRAISTAVGRLGAYPEWLPLIRPLMEALLAEVEHPDIARDDSAKLARKTSKSGDGRLSPPAFAVAAIARSLCEERHPFSHLGFFYLLEGTTSELAPRMQEILEKRGVRSPFVALHAKEDAEHSAHLRSIIKEIVAKEPAIAVEIEYGYDCFAVAYPIPVWNSACVRALAERG